MSKKKDRRQSAAGSDNMVGNVYGIQSARYGMWALYQIVHQEAGELGMLGLDWFEDRLPTEAELERLKPGIITYNDWRGKPEAFIVSGTGLPKAWILAGAIAPLFSEKIASYRTGLPTPYSLTMDFQHRWDGKDEAARRAYKEATANPQPVQFDGADCLTNSLVQNVLADTPYDWHKLDVFPKLTHLNVWGRAEGLREYCATRPLLTKLQWTETGRKMIDLSGTPLEEISIDITGVESITLGAEARMIGLTGSYASLSSLQVAHPGAEGKFCELNLPDFGSQSIPAFNLPQLQGLTIRCDEVDMTEVAAAYPSLHSFTARGNPGAIRNLSSLQSLPRLRSLMLVDMFGFTAADFSPPNAVPNLESIWLSSVSKEAGAWVKKAYRHIPDLNVCKLRSDDWLTVNANNPFRDWDGRQNILPAHAEKAFDVYKNTGKALQKLSPKDVSTDAFLSIIKDFIAAFNKIEKKSGLFTVEREDVGEALKTLVSNFPEAAREAALDLFGELVDF